MPEKNGSDSPSGNPNGETFGKNPGADLPKEGVMSYKGAADPDQEEEGSEKPTGRIHWINHATFYLSVILAVFTLATVRVYYLQLNRMVEANKINREALVSVQRAFVYVDGFTITPVTSVANKKRLLGIQVQGQIKNTGVTQAVDSRYHINFHVADIQRLENYSFPDFDEKGALLSMDQAMRAFFAPQSSGLTFPVSISFDNLRKTQQGHHLYLYGWIRYRDVFVNTEPHVTMFCYELIFDATPITTPQSIRTVRYNPCPKHNCVDEQCSAEQGNGNAH
jgi:hypothetical protein